MSSTSPVTLTLTVIPQGHAPADDIRPCLSLAAVQDALGALGIADATISGAIRQATTYGHATAYVREPLLLGSFALSLDPVDPTSPEGMAAEALLDAEDDADQVEPGDVRPPYALTPTVAGFFAALTDPSAEVRARIAAEAAAAARADREYADDRSTRGIVLAHLKAVRTRRAAAALLVDALDADYSSTLTERDAAAVADSVARFALLVAEEAASLTIGETTSGRRIEPDRIGYAVRTLALDAEEVSGWSSSTVHAIEAAAHRAAARATRTRFEQ